MKTRSGFVSNSSSTSFTCDVCGEDVSGMGLGLREAGMCQCWNGHTFCENHQCGDVKELTTEEQRQVLVNNAQSAKLNDYWTVERRDEEVQKMKDLPDDDVEDAFDDFTSDAGINPEYCPICMFKKPYVPDLFKYLVRKCATPADAIMAEVKDEFKTYTEFKKYINSL